MKFWRDKVKNREAHHPDGRFLVRQIHLLATIHAKDHLSRFCETRDPKALERYQTMHDFQKMVRRMEKLFNNDSQQR